MTVEIAIVAHPNREQMAVDLGNKVNADAISWDNWGMGASHNHQQSWQYLKSADTDWVCVLEDDAMPMPGFRNQLDQVLRHCPSDICSLYLGRGRPDQWQLPISTAICQDVSFLQARTLIHGVGYAIRTPLLAPLSRAVEHLPRHVELAEGIGRWARRHGHTIMYCRPSIIDHQDGPPVIADADREDGQSRAVAPNPSGSVVRKAWLVGTRPTAYWPPWDSSVAQIPPPDLRRRDKVAPHVTAV